MPPPVMVKLVQNERTTWEKVAPYVMLPPLYRLSIGAANIASWTRPSYHGKIR